MLSLAAIHDNASDAQRMYSSCWQRDVAEMWLHVNWNASQFRCTSNVLQYTAFRYTVVYSHMVYLLHTDHASPMKKYISFARRRSSLNLFFKFAAAMHPRKITTHSAVFTNLSFGQMKMRMAEWATWLGTRLIKIEIYSSIVEEWKDEYRFHSVTAPWRCVCMHICPKYFCTFVLAAGNGIPYLCSYEPIPSSELIELIKYIHILKSWPRSYQIKLVFILIPSSASTS